LGALAGRPRGRPRRARRAHLPPRPVLAVRRVGRRHRPLGRRDRAPQGAARGRGRAPGRGSERYPRPRGRDGAPPGGGLTVPTLLATRRAVPGDAPAIAPLLGQLGYPSTPDQVAARFARIAGRGDDAVWVAEDETGTVVGLATGHVHRPLERDLPLAQLTALVVDASR